MNDKVTSIKSEQTPPDCLILDSDTTLMVEHNTRIWKAGVPITDARDIAVLVGLNIPAKRYELIS